jgi:hypothetical protein
MPSRVLSASEHFSMEVESVDKKRGEVVLKGRDGKTMKLHVDRDLHNLKKIHPGDWLMVTVYEEAVVSGAKGGVPSSSIVYDIKAGPKTGKPTLRATEIIQLVAKVVDIDYKNRTMVLEGPTGARETVKVKDDVKDLENLKPGDTVTATINKTILMEIKDMD